MTYPLFPALPIGWSVHRSPLTSTQVLKHVSGRSVRRSLYAQPLFSFELVIEALSSGGALGGVPAGSMQQLQGFFTDRLGQWGPFCYKDPLDNATQNQIIGIGDGITTSFPLVWTLGSVAVPVGQVEPNGFSCSVAGTPQAPSSYSLVLPNTVIFSTAPGIGQQISASYTWYFLCCFDEDTLDFEEFMSNLWTVNSIKFTSIKL